MRCEDLFEQRRSGTRQSDYEDRRIALTAESLACGEKIAVADRDLQARIAFDGGRPVAALLFLERIAPLIVLERLCVFAAVLERLTQRETHMVAIAELYRGVGLLNSHPLEFQLAEAISLKVGKAPICLAEFGPDGRGRAIVFDRLFLIAAGFERMPQGQVQFGVARSLAEQLPVQRDGSIHVTEPEPNGGIGRAANAVTRIDRKQMLNFLLRLHVFVLLQ